MKKLMIFTMMACVAIAANAANVNWKMTGWYAPVATAEEMERLLLMAFINSLDNEIDREIMYRRSDGATQKEIAMTLGYANHTPVTKRLKRLEKEFDAFIKKKKGN